MTIGDAAVKAIGENPRGNINLRPKEHATNLASDPVAGPLLAIFAAQIPLPGRDQSQSINVKETIDLYCERDEKALKHQRQYDLSKMTIMSSLMLAIVVSGLVTALGLPRDVDLNAYPWLHRYGVPVDPEWYKSHMDWITRPTV